MVIAHSGLEKSKVSVSDLSLAGQILCLNSNIKSFTSTK